MVNQAKKIILTFALLVSMTCTPLALASVLMGPVTNPDNGHSYLLLSQSNWTDAENEALSLGGHLATINDAAEQEWLLSIFSPSRDRHLWIGLNDASQEGLFVWVNDDPFLFSNFPPGEPNNFGGIEDYTYIDVAHGDAWNDLANINEQIAPGGFYIPLHGVVEFSAESVPEPSMLALFSSTILTLLWIRKRRILRK